MFSQFFSFRLHICIWTRWTMKTRTTTTPTRLLTWSSWVCPGKRPKTISGNISSLLVKSWWSSSRRGLVPWSRRDSDLSGLLKTTNYLFLFSCLRFVDKEVEKKVRFWNYFSHIFSYYYSYTFEFLRIFLLKCES